MTSVTEHSESNDLAGLVLDPDIDIRRDQLALYRARRHLKALNGVVNQGRVAFVLDADEWDSTDLVNLLFEAKRLFCLGNGPMFGTRITAALGQYADVMSEIVTMCCSNLSVVETGVSRKAFQTFLDTYQLQLEQVGNDTSSDTLAGIRNLEVACNLAPLPGYVRAGAYGVRSFVVSDKHCQIVGGGAVQDWGQEDTSLAGHYLVNNICVRASYRKSGLGSMLNKFCMQESRNYSTNTFCQLYGQTYPGNDPAQHMLKQCGLTRNGNLATVRARLRD